MSSSYRVALSLLLLSISFFSVGITAAPLQFPTSFPIPMTFRAFDGHRVGDPSFTEELEKNAQFPIIAGMGGLKKETKIAIAKKKWPDKIILIGDGYGGVSEKIFDQVWPGHVLYKPGTKLASDLTAQATALVVEDHRKIAGNERKIQRVNKQTPFTLTIYALDQSGKPDWSQSEYVVVESVDPATKTFIVKRGQWGTKPLTFQKGKAVVAPRMMFWSGQWQLNLSLHSPRGGRDNLTAAEWYARLVADRVIAANADGVELDVGRWTWGFPEKNPMDANNDGVADYGYINGVNSFGLGGQVLFKELRQRLGNDKIIQVDSNDAINGVRGWKYLNGIQIEAFPAANDFDWFSPIFLHLRLWSDNAEALPKFSYPFTKAPTTVFANDHLPNGAKTDFRFRVGLASACMVGMPHTFANIKSIKIDPSNPSNRDKDNPRDFGTFAWDEYHGGDLNDWRWLGKPVAAAVQDLSNLNKTNLLANAHWKWSVDKGFTAQSAESEGSFWAIVQTIPGGMLPKQMWPGVSLAPKEGGLTNLTPGHEYTLEFDARGDDIWRYTNQTFEHVPRMITITGSTATKKDDHPLAVLADAQWRSYRVSFTADSSHALTPVFGVAEQIGTTEIRNIKLYEGSAERWSREFEKGLVLLNMSNEPWRVAVRKDYYRRLKGSQAPEVNNGQPIDSEVIVPPSDALFLVKR